MAKAVWEVSKTIWCDALKRDADLLEERVYPDDEVPDVAQPYHVRARKCSFGLECNLDGYYCRWSALNPNYDPFVEK